MTAQPSSRHLPPPHRPSRRQAPRVRRSRHRDPNRPVVFEVSARLGVNVLLGLMAISALIRLLPYNLSQQARLQEIRAEVAKLDERVDRLQAEFDRNFDPHQTLEVMREQSARLTPNQRQIIWMEPSSASTAQKESDTAPKQAFSLQRD